MEHNQNMIAMINHQSAMQIKFHDHSWLSIPSVTEKNWLLSHGHFQEVAIIERFKYEALYGLSARTKVNGHHRDVDMHCGEVAISGGSTVVWNQQVF